MFCTYCHGERLANESPCLHCGAPSPLVDESMEDASSPQNTQHSKHNGVSQLSFDDPMPPVYSMSPSISFDGFTPLPQTSAILFDAKYFPSDERTTPDPGSPADEHATSDPASSGDEYPPTRPIDFPNANINPDAPVPYLVDTPPTNSQTTTSLQLIPEQMVEHLLPVQSQQVQVNEESVARIPSFYKGERMFIPRKRVLGGFVSIIIVSLLLCVGAGYFVRVNGTWDRIMQLFNPPKPANIQVSTPQLTDPTVIYVRGDAADTVPSATLTNDFDQQSGVVRQEVHAFRTGQIFYLVCSGLPTNLKGTLSFKWFMNNLDFANNTYQLAPDPKDAHKLVIISLSPDPASNRGTIVKTVDTATGTTGTIDLSMQYDQAAEGFVEVYWNDKMAWRLYFVVR